MKAPPFRIDAEDSADVCADIALLTLASPSLIEQAPLLFNPTACPALGAHGLFEEEGDVIATGKKRMACDDVKRHEIAAGESKGGASVGHERRDESWRRVEDGVMEGSPADLCERESSEDQEEMDGRETDGPWSGSR